MDDFASKMGVPNMFGLIQGPANAIAPGKRPLSSMTPTIVLEDGKLRYVLGSPGGARIITTVGEYFSFRCRRRPQHSGGRGRPRFHHQDLPDKLYLEPGFNPDVQAKLKAMGYTLAIGDRPLVERRMHCRRSQDRRTHRRPGPPQPLRKAAGY